MTLRFTGDGPPVEAMLSQAMELYTDVANEVFAAIQKVKSGEWDARNATHIVREMRSFFELVLQERAKIARQREKDEGVVNDDGLDLGAARTEIGRRLACLRDSRGG